MRKRATGLPVIVSLIVALAAASAFGDTWPPPRKETVCSLDRHHCLEIVPKPVRPHGWGAEPHAVFRKGPRKGQSFPLFNDVRPVEMLVSSSGRVVTLDNWYARGKGPGALVIYGTDGSLVRQLALGELLNEPDINGLPHVDSSIYWYDRAWIDEGTQSLRVAIKSEGRVARYDAHAGEIEVDLASGVVVSGKQQLFFYADPHATVGTGADVELPGQPIGRCAAEDHAGAEHVSSASLLAAAVDQAPLKYPAIAKAASVSGTVAVEVFVDAASGEVTCARPLAGAPLLIGATVQAVQRWKFDLSKRTGDAALVAGVLVFTFELTRPDPPVHQGS